MSHIENFRKKFHIDQKADLRNALVAVDAIYEANRIATEYLSEIDPSDAKTGFRIHSLLNLLGRIFEHSEGMLVAISTGSPASAEALSRIVVEGSINVMYLATIGNPSTLIQFFRSWLNEHERKLGEWKETIKGESYADKVSAMIDERSDFIQSLGLYVDKIESQSLIDPCDRNTEWPKSLFKRFEAMGRKTDYYESYHRLSGASHLTGEDTLLWLISLEMPIEQKIKMAKEAWAYSTMMSRIACTFFVDAAAACVIGYGRSSNEDLQKLKQSLGRSVQSIAKEAGVPH
ncbi:hypothetical protein D3879_15725 [Pseudomonas cavernicola]|uniref:Uncharacterized protein n=1 Tax=Pseudomonas cavernicola TaxID=2320866 RepID=A0A418XFC5_9PSED|nr:DUF5677 domain-containing protein [Pseudomonas cavernicola]RJG11108.1 hypothetical protein D3879_15725 [Pseudomonas cavernicola]